MTALAGGVKIPTHKWEAPGQKVRGTILEAEDFHEKAYKSDTKWKYWGSDGKPVELTKEEGTLAELRKVEGVRVQLQLPGTSDIEGRVNVFVSGKNAMDAARDGAAKAGRTDFEIMDDFEMVFTGYQGTARTFQVTITPFDPAA